jgi:hypothetical protein
LRLLTPEIQYLLLDFLSANQKGNRVQKLSHFSKRADRQKTPEIGRTDMRIIFIAMFMASCGTDPKDFLKEKPDSLSLNNCPEVSVPRFDGCKVAKLYTEASKPDSNGNQQPVSNLPLWSVWKFAEAPQALKDEWKTGEVIAEVFGYVNLGKPSDSKNVVSLLERSSRFSKILDEKGKPVFKDSYSTNQNWQKMPDSVDGKVSGEVETKQMILMVPLSEDLAKDARMEISYREKDGVVTAYMFNKVAISVDSGLPPASQPILPPETITIGALPSR